jgi:hypothetical protein
MVVGGPTTWLDAHPFPTRPMRLRLVTAAAAAVLAGAGVLAVSSLHADEGATTAPPRSVATSVAPVKALPAPAGDAVLRITGVARGNVTARTTKVDLATLDAVGHESVTVHEPFLKHDVTFTGVRMSKLLLRAGVSPSARTLRMHALDDYQVDLPIAEFATDGMLATRADGKPIPIAKGGPIRLIFTASSAIAANTDNWIWSLDSVQARG